ncbi:MAG: CDP-glucose 4,6-dehydratase [Victivallaceae bacterium]|jgi:CDP-glucose 4,6-dehydratase
MFGNIYSGKRVLVTGHTGFKGSWLVLWLKKLGAEVAGYALPPPTTPSHYDLISPDINSINGCILDPEKMERVFIDFSPEIVFHLAAQPLVRLSYTQPKETFETNVIGTVNVLDVCRRCSSVCAIVNITSDKCYENREWVWGYRENDAMGGYDPYSASKGCAELVAASYRNSFFNPSEYGRKHHTLLASCRAGNVIGGGDWAADRLIPDIMKAAAQGKTVEIRNPHAVRPWQHVLEPLSGYLQLGQKLLEGKPEFSGAWNFGPDDAEVIAVKEVVERMKLAWPDVSYSVPGSPEQPHEAGVLKLDCSKAATFLKWHGAWDSATTFARTANWYREFYENSAILSDEDIGLYIKAAEGQHLEWTK